jgi:hypothetical protein
MLNYFEYKYSILAITNPKEKIFQKVNQKGAQMDSLRETGLVVAA